MTADFIEMEEDPVRALIVMSGNPLLAVGGEDRVRNAFLKLDLIVSLDYYRNATAEMADFILPAADWLEREDINHIANGVQPTPYVQYADAVVPPAFERKDDWWILARIEQELGLPSLLDGGPDDYLQTIEGVLAAADLSIAKLREMPHQTALLPQTPRDAVYTHLIMTADKKVDCCPPLFASALERCESIFVELEQEDPTLLKLISLRTHYMHNSHLANMRFFKDGRHALNPLHIHPADAQSRNMLNGDVARIYNGNGMVETAIEYDETLRPGVVALSHGYGHAKAPGIQRANALPGVNVNKLMPIGPGSYERLSNMSHMNGVVVHVEKSRSIGRVA
jgi:anaerobic selenocysteine-containing dehydrogenase